jgi:hypothetical protein
MKSDARDLASITEGRGMECEPVKLYIGSGHRASVQGIERVLHYAYIQYMINKLIYKGYEPLNDDTCDECQLPNYH